MTLPRQVPGLDVLVERSQAICARPADYDLASLVRDLHGLLSAVPEALTPREQHFVRGVLGQALSSIAVALGDDGARDECQPNDWVSRVLGVIRARYRDPLLSLSMVAKVADLSPWHVARTLKSQTGRGFVGHLRDVRVQAARRLLAEDVLSVKEIAVEVGYAHPNQLDRDFMRVCHVTPSSFRRRISPQESMFDRKK